MEICSSARFVLEDRIYLYSKSIVNLIQPSGPAGLSTLTKGAKTIITNYGKGSIDDNLDYFKKLYKLNLGDQPYLDLGTFFNLEPNI